MHAHARKQLPPPMHFQDVVAVSINQARGLCISCPHAAVIELVSQAVLLLSQRLQVPECLAAMPPVSTPGWHLLLC